MVEIAPAGASQAMTPAERRIKHLVLALEVALGVVPVTIVGGLYVLMGMLFGTFSLIVSVQRHSLSAFVWWLGVFALALGGLAGLSGLWLLVLDAVKAVNRTVRMAAFAASTVGVVTAVIALVLAERGSAAPHWWIVYLLVSPIIVVCHRALVTSGASRL